MLKADEPGSFMYHGNNAQLNARRETAPFKQGGSVYDSEQIVERDRYRDYPDEDEHISVREGHRAYSGEKADDEHLITTALEEQFSEQLKDKELEISILTEEFEKIKKENEDLKKLKGENKILLKTIGELEGAQKNAEKENELKIGQLNMEVNALKMIEIEHKKSVLKQKQEEEAANESKAQGTKL